MSIRTVPTVMNMEPIIMVMLSLNLVLSVMHRDIMRFLNTTTVAAPTYDVLPVDCMAFRTDMGTKNALPTH